MRGKLIAALFGIFGMLVGAALVLILRPHGAGGPFASDRPTSAELALDRPLPDVRLKDVPFDEALATLGRLVGVPIHADWVALEQAGYDRRRRVDLFATGITLDDALRRLIEQLPERHMATNPVGYAGDGAAVVVTRQDWLQPRPVVRAYDVTRLLGPDGGPPEPATEGGSLFGGRTVRAYDRRVEELAAFVANAVGDESWNQYKGGIGSIRAVAGRLVIVQTEQNHRHIRRLLEALNDAAAAPTGPPRPDAGVLVWDEQKKRSFPQDLARADAALRKTVPDLNLDGVRLGEALDALRWQTGANLVLDRPALAAEGFREVPVSIRLKGATLAEALDRVLRTQGDLPGLGYAPDRASITITTRGTAQRVTFTRIYNLRDWPRPGAAAAASVPAGPEGLTEGVTYEEWEKEVGRVAELIQNTVASGGHVRAVDGLLIVTQTWESHEKVRAFLDTLRAAAALPGPATRPAADTTQAILPDAQGDRP